MPTEGKTIVLSDIHFGVSECSIGMCIDGSKLYARERRIRERNIQNFFDYLNNLGNLQRVILLGDIFDLQLSNLSTAIKASALFFQNLRRIETLREIIYIPGNHDHILWFLHIFRQYFINELEGGPSTVISEDFQVTSDPKTSRNIFLNDDSFLKNIFGNHLTVRVIYPFLAETINEKKYFFIHGHFFDSQQTIYYNLVKQLYPKAASLLNLDFRGISDPNLDELEFYCSPLYHTIMMFGRTSAGRNRLKEIYQKIEGFKWGHITDLDDENFIKRIEKFLNCYGGQEGANKYFDVMDFLIFGHTHYAETNLYRYPNPNLKVINTGCWLSDQKTIGNFLVIDPNEEYPMLMIMNQEGEISEHSSSSEMRQGKRPKKRGRLFSFTRGL